MDKKSALILFLEKSSEKISKDLDAQIRLTSLNSTVLDFWEKEWKVNSTRIPPNGGWDWRSHYLDFKRRKPKQLYSLAVWHGDVLCGMTIGYTSKGPTHVRLDLIEGAPDENHPLRGLVLRIIVDVSMNYAQLTRKEKLIIANPVPDLIDLYQRRGFTYIPEKKSFFGTHEDFCVKEVCYDGL